jgi:hypothetical protein
VVGDRLDAEPVEELSRFWNIVDREDEAAADPSWAQERTFAREFLFDYLVSNREEPLGNC